MRESGTGCMYSLMFDDLSEGIDYVMQALNTPSPMKGNNIGTARYYVMKQFGREATELAIAARIKQQEYNTKHLMIDAAERSGI